MHHANHFYGHAHVLARYCGLTGLSAERPPRIQGYLQHGWNIGDGLASGVPYVDSSAIFVWSEQTRRRAWSHGRRNAVVVGAPWLYLLALQDQLALRDQLALPDAATQPSTPSALTTPARTPTERTGTIWYPFHGWEGQQVRGDHRRLIDTIRAVEPGPVTVCLYWNEFHHRSLRRRYERAGFRVICHGYRGHWWEGTDNQFLFKQLAALRSHRRVASNRLSSAVFYGISVGCEPAVYGDPMVLRDEDPTHGGFGRIARQWATLHGEQIELDSAREIAAAELGVANQLGPVELREVLGWPHLLRPPTPGARAIA